MSEDEPMAMEKDISSNDDIYEADKQETNATEEEENGNEESNDTDNGKEVYGDDSENEEDGDGSFHELTYQ